MKSVIYPAAPSEPTPIELDHMTRMISDVPQQGWDPITCNQNRVYQTGDLIIDDYGKMVFKNGVSLNLTPIEYDLVLHMVENVTVICTRSSLKNLISMRYHHQIGDNTLSKHIHRTRVKLGQGPYGSYVLTRNSKGYKWGMPVTRRYISRTERL